jgi:ribosomal protein S18 acetylase RimI-like enzyme
MVLRSPFVPRIPGIQPACPHSESLQGGERARLIRTFLAEAHLLTVIKIEARPAPRARYGAIRQWFAISRAAPNRSVRALDPPLMPMRVMWSGMLHDYRVSVVVRACISIADVAAIEETLPSGATRLHRSRFERTDGSVYLLAWVDAVAVGHVLVTPVSKYPEIREQLGRFPEVNGLAVADIYRHRGVARALMRAAAAETVRMGSDRLGLAVEPGNEPAIHLYEALGFERAHLDLVDVWAWVDEDGQEHEERDLCTYWAQAIGAQ